MPGCEDLDFYTVSVLTVESACKHYSTFSDEKVMKSVRDQLFNQVNVSLLLNRRLELNRIAVAADIERKAIDEILRSMFFNSPTDDWMQNAVNYVNERK